MKINLKNAKTYIFIIMISIGWGLSALGSKLNPVTTVGTALVGYSFLLAGINIKRKS